MSKQAAVLIIGNEILSGKTVDTNSPYLAKELRKLGVELSEIVIVPDDVERIAEKIRDLAKRFEFVFTSGGVGPTHDDVTMAGIARAFGKPVVRHSDLTKRLAVLYQEELNDERLRMAEVPEGSHFLAAEALRFPVIVFQNIYIFPGIPEIFREKFEAIKERFREAPFHLKNIYVNMPEGKLAAYLNDLLKRYPELMVGSYPVMNNPTYRVKVTVESKNNTVLEEASQQFLKALPSELIVNVESA